MRAVNYLKIYTRLLEYAVTPYRGKPCAKLVPYEEINKQGAGVIEVNALIWHVEG